MSDLQKTAEALTKAFEDFKALNDQRIAALEKGKASAEISAAVDKVNADITALTAKLHEQQKQLREVETQAARLAPTGSPEAVAKERKDAVAFYSQVRAANGQKDNLDVVNDADLDGYRAYKKAIVAYMRRGPEGLASEYRAALSVGTDPSGGYWVTPDTTGRIAQLVFESSPIRQIASVQPIGSDRLEGFNDLDEAGGGWVGETSARPETTTPEMGKWEIPVHEQYAEPRTTQKLLDDANVDVEGWLAKKVSSKLARLEATAFVSGDGVSKPTGFLTFPNASAPTKANWKRVEFVTSGANGAFAASNPGDKLIDMIAVLKQPYRNGARWVTGRLVVAAIRKLKDGQGNYLWLPSFQDGMSGSLLGFPITEAEDMPALATNSYSLAFGNFAEAYQIVDRIGIRVLRDPYTTKPYIKFYTTARVGGDMVNYEALKLMKFAA